MRILFMGTPEFAVASLARLCADGHDLCGIFCQPDRPKNRGMKLIFPPVKQYAVEHGIPVFQPTTLKDGMALDEISTLAPELIVVAAYGRILPPEILEVPKYGCINVHSSLLPKYRGAAPIHWAILRGETETGVTIMYMAQELDAGDILRVKRTDLLARETAGELHDRLAILGAEAVSETVKDIAVGAVVRTPQNHEAATFAPMLDRSLSPIDWSRASAEIMSQVRGLIPWPVATMEVAGRHLKVYEMESVGDTDKAPGAVVSADKSGIVIACGDGKAVVITQVQAEGSKRMSAADYLRGHPIG